ncbi:MAG: exopolysaccharide biosynthesis polyprenyl glycosylphosphotransferase [Pseudomonadota bacterium]
MAALNAALMIGAMFIAAFSSVLFLKRVVNSGLKTAFLRQSDGAEYAWAGGSGKLELETYAAPGSANDNERVAAGRFSGIKRFIDCFASISLLILLAPFLILTAVAIKLDSPGPVLYRQKRIGFRGERIDVFKFRSMIVDAEKDGPQYAKANDSRVTRVGRWIRRTRIDEIPQTINVLRGEMSFVGPRPERPEFVAVLEKEIPHYHHRHLVKPGITGWAQVKYEYAASVEGAREKLRFDLFYIRHFTPLLDIVIILMTIRVALFGIGSR